MKPQLGLAIITTVLLAAPVTSAAQSTVEVTVRVPVILTQFSPDLKSIGVSCSLRSDALINTDPSHPNAVGNNEWITLSSGEAIKVVTMVFSVTLSNPAGKAASVVCFLHGETTMTDPFAMLNENASNPAYRVTKASVVQVQTDWVW